MRDRFQCVRRKFTSFTQVLVTSVMIYKIILLVISFIWKAEGKDCVPRKFAYDSVVCVCNATYCDSTPDVGVPKKGNFNWYVSSQAGLRLGLSKGKFNDEFNENSTNQHEIKISIDRDKVYQAVNGFGGAFTDSSGINMNSLSEKTQNMLLESYFGREGSRYNFGRLPMGATDFSTRLYTYADVKNDVYLKHFRLAKEDLEYKIPFIKKAKKLSNDLKILSAVWTPPLWMKTNDDYYGPSFLKREYYQTFADYIMKFLRAYKSHGVEIWGVSTGNEPIESFIPFRRTPSVGWLPYQLGEWVGNNLGPSIINSELNETYIIVLDDQRFLLNWYIDWFFSNTAAYNVVNGIAVHWYLDNYISAEVLNIAHNKYPDKFLLMTEACVGFKITYYPKVQLGSWEGAEEYILDIIDNMRHWVTGWIDWNLVLDKKGGPNWLNNFVNAAVIVNPETDEFFKQPQYYAIKHFSRFVERESVRIESSESDEVKSIAFENPSKTIVVILCNKSSKSNNVLITDSKSGTIKISLAPRSIHTIEYT